PTLESRARLLSSPASTCSHGSHSLCVPAARHQSSRLRIGEIEVAKLRNRLSLAGGSFVGSGVCLSRDVAEKLSRLLTRTLGGPRRAMLAYGEPPLAPLRCSVLQHVGNSFTLLPTCAKTAKR